MQSSVLDSRKANIWIPLMTPYLPSLLFQAILLTPALPHGQQARAPEPPQSSAPIVQPGAPGKPSKVISLADATGHQPALSAADTEFMQGMIMHHNQAVTMTGMIDARTHDEAVRALGSRIRSSQTDEMKFMKSWLEARGQSTHMQKNGMDMDMAGMDMGPMPMMPGMLTPEQMKMLEAARGPEFDHLFLSGMIQHHTGALTMVNQLFGTAGAGQDADLFDFATDVDNTQRAEIRIMQGLLEKEHKEK